MEQNLTAGTVWNDRARRSMYAGMAFSFAVGLCAFAVSFTNVYLIWFEKKIKLQ